MFSCSQYKLVIYTFYTCVYWDSWGFSYYFYEPFNIIWKRPIDICYKYLYSTCFYCFILAKHIFNYLNNLHAIKFTKQSIYLIFEMKKKEEQKDLF